MIKFKKLALTATAAVLAAGGAVAASPQSASANSGNRVCLTSNSATYAYITVKALPTGKTAYVNRGQCSSNDWGYDLTDFRPAPGFTCRDQNGKYFYGGTWYSAWSYPNRTLQCKVNNGSWGLGI